jgi:hypothetical protein
MGTEGQPRDCRHAQPGNHQRLHHDHVVGRVADSRLKAFVGTQREQVAATPFAAGDPGRIVQCSEFAYPALRKQVHRIVEQVVESDVVGLGLGLVVAEDDRDVDLAGAQQLERLGRMRVGQRDLQVGMPGG